jgi:hypothetical protein
MKEMRAAREAFINSVKQRQEMNEAALERARAELETPLEPFETNTETYPQSDWRAQAAGRCRPQTGRCAA